MPWTRGPNVCAMEEVNGGSRKRYYADCMAFIPRRICEKPTFVRYHCCTGYEKEDNGRSTGCQAVKPVDNLLQMTHHLFLRDFRKYLRTSGFEDLLSDMSTTYTVFVPQNKAFNELPQDIKDHLSIKSPTDRNLLLYHIVPNRFQSIDLRNAIEIQTLYRDNQTLLVHKYTNRILTVNCVRIILPNQPATNGIIHVTEQVVRPVERHVTLLDVLTLDDRFVEFVTALVMTSISTELKTAVHYTVFAPTDAAFRSVDRASLNRILNDVELLKKLIYYHIIDCCICSAAILGPTSVRTLEGQKVNLTCDVIDRLTVNDVVCSEVDVMASNGVIHVFDKVLIPDSVKTIGQILDQMGLWTFLEYARDAGMEDILDARQGTEQLTIFAPNDLAFKKLNDSQRKRLRSGDAEVLKVLEYHTVSGKITTKQMVGTEALNTRTTEEENGKALFLNINVEEYSINNARIISGDHVVANGVVHVIDRVLQPPDDSIVDKIKENPQLSTLLNLLQLSGLDSVLEASDQPTWTVFAPTNAAFDRMDDRQLSRLMDNRTELLMFLNYHVLERAVFLSCAVRPRLHFRFQTATKDWIRVKQPKDGDPIRINEHVTVALSDIHGVNGVMHVIDRVLTCPCLRN